MDCGNKYVSLSGGIALINLVLNSVPSFYFSYTNMPIKVLSKVVKIQREFFRGVGRLLENKLSEEEIHLSSKEHRLRVSNLSLLAK